MGIKHAKVSAIEDGADETLILPSDWNAEHTGGYTDADAKAAAVQAGAITNGVTKAPTHDAVYDVKVTADAAQTAGEVDADIATHAADDDAHHAKYTDAEAVVAAKTVKLDELTAPTDVTTLNASTDKHGLLPKLNNNAAQFFNGQGAWATPAGAGDMLVATYDPQSVGGDAFDTDNHTDGTTNKVYTATEKTKLTGIATGADVTADNAPKAHTASHAVSGADTVFPADPAADKFLMWDDDPGELVWSSPVGGGDVSVSGVPTDGQVGIWTDGTTVEGAAMWTHYIVTASDGMAAAKVAAVASGGSVCT